MPDTELPTQHDRKVKLLELMSEGQTMTEACREIGITRTTVWRWRKDDEDFAGLYDDAHKAMATAIADDALTVVKNLTKAGVNPTKEQVAAASAYSQRASWYASKLLPKVYGDNTGPTQVNNFNGPVQALVCNEEQRMRLIETRHEALRLANVTEAQPNENIQPNHPQPTGDSDSVEEPE